MNAISTKNNFRSLAAARPESFNGTDVEWSWRYLLRERVRSREEWSEKKRGEKAECRKESAAGGCERYYQGLTRGGGLVVNEWGGCVRGRRGGGGKKRAESIKSNVWWRYNEMNLCRAVMPEYLATLFWFCSWPDRHPSCYTVFELNSTTGPPLQGLKRPQSG